MGDENEVKEEKEIKKRIIDESKKDIKKTPIKKISVSVDAFLSQSEVVRKTNRLLVAGYKVFMKQTHPSMLGKQNDISEWEEKFHEYVNKKIS